MGYLRVWLNRNSWMNSRCSGPQLILTQSPVTHRVPRKSMITAQITRTLIPPPDAKRPSSGALPEIYGPLPDAECCILSEECPSFSVTGKNGCVSSSMSHGFCAPVTICKLSSGLMQWSSAYTGAKACHAPNPTKVYEACPNDSSSGTSSRRQATVESDSL